MSPVKYVIKTRPLNLDARVTLTKILVSLLIILAYCQDQHDHVDE